MNQKDRNLNADFLEIALEEIEAENYGSAEEFIEDVAENMLFSDANMKGYVNTLYGAKNRLKDGECEKAKENVKAVFAGLRNA